MALYMKYIHIWSVNIILLMFIFGAIGYILNQKTNKQIITNQLFKYYNIILAITIISGLLMIIMNQFWISFPTFQYKLFVTFFLIILSLLHSNFFLQQSNTHSILTIILIIGIYSLSLLIGSYSNG